IEFIWVWLAPDGQPNDAIRERKTHLAIMREGGRKHALANAAHALNGSCAVLRADERRLVYIGDDQLTQRIQRIGTVQIRFWFCGDTVMLPDRCNRFSKLFS